MVEPLIHPAHKTEVVNRLENIRFCLFVFNGKEKDYESGFHYYGARYYWSEVLTGWLSVDPMMDKYPGISPYNYCMWNPVKIIDPNGMDTIYYNLNKNKIKTVTSDNNVIMLALTTGNDPEPQKSVDVRYINLDRMDALYSYSDKNNIENAYYVNYDGTESNKTFYGTNRNCTIEGGPYMYDVHTHCKNIFKNGKIADYGSTEPSTDKDMAKPEGFYRFGIILGYAERPRTDISKTFRSKVEYDPNAIKLDRQIGFYNTSGRFENIRYDKFKETVIYLQNKVTSK